MGNLEVGINKGKGAMELELQIEKTALLVSLLVAHFYLGRSLGQSAHARRLLRLLRWVWVALLCSWRTAVWSSRCYHSSGGYLKIQ